VPPKRVVYFNLGRDHQSPGFRTQCPAGAHRP
jgi:hypothetical protein